MAHLNVLPDFTYQLTWPTNCQEVHTFLKVSGPAQVWKVNMTWEINQKVKILHKIGSQLKKKKSPVNLVIMCRSQVLKRQHGDLKIQVWFYLALALYFNGDQKSNTVLPLLPWPIILHLGHFWKKCQHKWVSVADFTKAANLLSMSNQNLILLSERQVERDVRKKKKWYFIQLIRRKPKIILPFFPPLMVPYPGNWIPK